MSWSREHVAVRRVACIRATSRVIHVFVQQACSHENHGYSSNTNNTTVTFSTCAPLITAPNITGKRREAIWRPVASDRMTEHQAIKPAARYGTAAGRGRMRPSRLGLLPPADIAEPARVAVHQSPIARSPAAKLSGDASRGAALPAGTIAVLCVSAGSLQPTNNGHQRRSLRTRTPIILPYPRTLLLRLKSAGRTSPNVNLILTSHHTRQRLRCTAE